MEPAAPTSEARILHLRAYRGSDTPGYGDTPGYLKICVPYVSSILLKKIKDKSRIPEGHRPGHGSALMSKPGAFYPHSPPTLPSHQSHTPPPLLLRCLRGFIAAAGRRHLCCCARAPSPAGPPCCSLAITAELASRRALDQSSHRSAFSFLASPSGLLCSFLLLLGSWLPLLCSFLLLCLLYSLIL